MAHLPAPGPATVVAWYGVLLLAPGAAATRTPGVVLAICYAACLIPDDRNLPRPP